MTSPEDAASPPSATSAPDDPRTDDGGNVGSMDRADAGSSERSPSDSGSAATGSADSGSADTGSPDTNATTELPATGWGSTSSDGASAGGPGAGGFGSGGSGAAGSSGPSWSSEETRNFPTYQPQSYPTYPPTQTNTSALPAVSAGGPPPTTAAAYGTPGPATAGAAGPTFAGATSLATTGATGKPARRSSAGIAGALGLIGLSAAAAGAFALPLQQYAQNQDVYFGTFRDMAAHKLSPNSANQHSISLVGGHIATDWWRFGVYITLGVLALLFLIKICVPVLRRLAGVLLFLGGLGAIAGFVLGARQTNDYKSVTVLGHIKRISWHHLAYGFWVALAGCAVVALAGLIATFQSTRRSN